ncbi:UTRA domain-containing protein [Reinekea forsetii]|nr:UTRA domain-containing protein [Reinekea forsetii]
MATPRFEVIKKHIIGYIEQGDWRPGDAVPSENQLAEQFEVSRMTARRALTDLTEAGVLERVQGAGTFVAEQLPTGSLLEIRNIADEIHERGHKHIAKVICLEQRTVTEAETKLIGLPVGAAFFYSQVKHIEEDTLGHQEVIQLEERYVNSEVAPDYLQQDFTQITPSAYLTSVSPLSQADHWVEAILAPTNIEQKLEISTGTPCLKLSRRTYSFRQNPSTKQKFIVNFAVLYHPGPGYRLGGHLMAS